MTAFTQISSMPWSQTGFSRNLHTLTFSHGSSTNACESTGNFHRLHSFFFKTCGPVCIESRLTVLCPAPFISHKTLCLSFRNVMAIDIKPTGFWLANNPARNPQIHPQAHFQTLLGTFSQCPSWCHRRRGRCGVGWWEGVWDAGAVAMALANARGDAL